MGAFGCEGRFRHACSATRRRRGRKLVVNTGKNLTAVTRFESSDRRPGQPVALHTGIAAMPLSILGRVVAVEVREGAIRLVLSAEYPFDANADVAQRGRSGRIGIVELQEEED